MMSLMKRLALIVAVVVFVLALCAQAYAGLRQSGPDPALGSTTVDAAALTQIEAALGRDPRVNFTADLSATNADLDLKAHGTLRARVIGPQGS